MFTKLAKMQRKEEGFTLIELLIVVAIIAILAAIAIPQFSAYKKRGYNASSNSDLRNIRTTEEAMNADFQEYGASTATVGGAGAEVGPGGTLTLAGGKTSSTNQSVSLSPNVYVAIKTDTNTLGTARTAYVAVTTHATGDNYYGADSDVTALYRMGWSGTYAAGQTLTATPASTASADDLSGVSNWTQMK